MPVSDPERRVHEALDGFTIELPSWGFANTGTRFATFVQDGAAVTLGHRLRDAGKVHELTGSCPRVALHVAWDFERGLESAEEVADRAEEYGVEVGSINPTLFEDPAYRDGSLANPDPAVRQKALDHVLESVEIAKATGSRDLVLWFADGSNYPGTAHIRKRRRRMQEGLSLAHDALAEDQRLLVEYKPFEPAFYHTDVADWGMALGLARAAGPKARVLVDTGHHYQSQNVEQIVAWMLEDGRLGGFHFNDRRYADDDLTMGSIDPYQLFRILHEIRLYAWEEEEPSIGYMIDQSHNVKNKMEAMVQTVDRAQELRAKSALVDRARLLELQEARDLVGAEECLRDAFTTDVRPMVRSWREARGLPADPLAALRTGGYLEEIARGRADRQPRDGGGYT